MNTKTLCIILILLIQLPLPVLAAEAEDQNQDITVLGFELEKLLNLGSGLLAIALFVLTLSAYKRSKNKRLLYVSIAFLLFAIKGILMSMEILFGDWTWVDPVASVLDFAILLSFFFGILKK